MQHRLMSAAVLVGALALSGCADDDSPDGADTSASSQTSTSSSSSAGSATSGAVDLAEKSFPVSWQDALKKAQAKFDGDISKIELEPDDTGKYAYKIELISDKQEYAVQVDAQSGDVVNEKTDDLDDDEVGTERKEKSVDPDKGVKLKEAMDTATGVQDGPINKWKLEGKASGPQYEFDIDAASGNEDYEIQVDAKSGKVITSGD